MMAKAFMVFILQKTLKVWCPLLRITHVVCVCVCVCVCVSERERETDNLSNENSTWHVSLCIALLSPIPGFHLLSDP